MLKNYKNYANLLYSTKDQSNAFGTNSFETDQQRALISCIGRLYVFDQIERFLANKNKKNMKKNWDGFVFFVQ